MNSNIDNCIDIYINADPREVYEKYGNTGCYTVETNFFKFAQNKKVNSTTITPENISVNGDLQVIDNNIHLKFPHEDRYITEVIEIPSTLTLGSNFDFTYYGMNINNECGNFVFKLVQTYKNGEIKYIIDKLYCRSRINKELYDNIEGSVYKLRFRVEKNTEDYYHLRDIKTYTTLPCGNKARTKVSIYSNDIVTQFHHNGIMMEEIIRLNTTFDSIHNACEYGNTKSKCGKFVWRYTNTIHDDSSVIEIEKKYFSKKRIRRRLFEDVDENLIQDSERTRKKPKRMVPDFNNASSSRYGYNIELL